MGFHGIVRAKLLKNYPYPTIAWGPYFGDGSPYAGVDADLYGDLEYWENGVLEVAHPPLVLDVAVENRGTDHHWLWAAADHLGVVGFDLDDPGGWDDLIYGSSGQYFHQEGIRIVEPGPQPPAEKKYWIQLVEGAPPQRHMTFARRIQVLESSSALLTATMPLPFLRHPGVLNMGRSLSWDFTSVGGVPECEFTSELDVDTGYTLAHCLDHTLTSGLINVSAVVDIGRHVHGPEVQGTGDLAFFAGRHAPKNGLRIPAPDRGQPYDHNTARVDFVGLWPPQGTPLGTPPADPLTDEDGDVVEREGEDRPGRWGYRASLNRANPQVLVTTSNDAGLPADGPLVLDLGDPGGARIEANFTKGGVHPDDVDGTQGITYEPSAAIAREESGDMIEYRFAYRRYSPLPPAVGGPFWRLSRFRGGTNVTDENTQDPPVETKAIFFSMPPDKFEDDGAYYYTGAGYCQTYTDATGKSYLFANARATPTASSS